MTVYTDYDSCYEITWSRAHVSQCVIPVILLSTYAMHENWSNCILWINGRLEIIIVCTVCPTAARLRNIFRRKSLKTNRFDRFYFYFFTRNNGRCQIKRKLHWPGDVQFPNDRSLYAPCGQWGIVNMSWKVWKTHTFEKRFWTNLEIRKF